MAEHSTRQPDQDDAIQHFLRWIEDHKIPGRAAADGSLSFFICPDQLRQYFTHDNSRNLRRLLYKLCPPPAYSPDEIAKKIEREHNGYMLSLATLLKIQEGRHIDRFVRFENMSDAHMPFTVQPKNFPLYAGPEGSDHLFTLFQKRQWMFCPLILEPWAREIEPERILPITNSEPLGSGSSAHTTRVTVHPPCNRLEQSGSRTPPSADQRNIYVMKTYKSSSEVAYRSEKRAFEHLRSSQTLNKSSLIRFYGSLECTNAKGEPSFSIILEHADGGDLEAMFTTDPPETPRDIATFWTEIFGLLEVLKVIHQIRFDHPDRELYLHGWHQDVKPQNILIVKRQDQPIHKGIFKLADLGLAHFRDRSVDRDRPGNSTYGAPETYRKNTLERQMPRQVNSEVDVWSLGCVLSEAVAWVVGGPKMLQRYRDKRFEETASIPNHEAQWAFHDGRDKVLNCVHEFHATVKDRVERGDHITLHVLDLIERSLLTESRASSSHAESIWARIKDRAEAFSKGQWPPSTPPNALGLSTAGSAPGNQEPSRLGSISHRVVSDVPGSIDSQMNVTTLWSPTLSPTQLPPPATPIFAEPAPLDKASPERRSQQHQQHLQDQSPPPPSWDVTDAFQWFNERKACRRGPKRQVPNNAYSKQLAKRDYVFMLDDSYTMRTHWKEAAELVELLAEVLFAQEADDAIDVCFVASGAKTCKSSSESLRKFVLKNFPPDQSGRVLDPRLALDQYLEAYYDRLRSRRPFRRGRRPLSLFVLTDARWLVHSNLEAPITRAMKVLEDMQKPQHFLGIQFIQFGTSEVGQQRLKKLDDLGHVADIVRVDQEPSTRCVNKMLLGPIDPTFDWDEDNIVYSGANGSSPPRGLASPGTSSATPVKSFPLTKNSASASTSVYPRLSRGFWGGLGRGEVLN